MAHQIFNAIVAEIKKGIVFKAGKQYADIIGEGLNIAFIQAIECGRPLLRIIFRDENGDCEQDILSKQFTLTGL